MEAATLEDWIVSTTLDWYGCATFRLNLPGLTVFLDAYIDRIPSAPGTGLTADDIEECDWIVIGHSHFDHLWGAERIIAQTGATLIGSYETVRVLEQADIPRERMICVAGGERIELGRGVFVSVYPSLHSCLWTGTHAAGSGDVCLGDLGVPWHERNRRMQALHGAMATSLSRDAVGHVMAAATGHSDRGDGGALIYLFETPGGSVLYQDTSGRWSPILEQLNPDLAILAAAGRGNADGEPVQGSLADFVADEARTLGAHRVVLAHHDNWLPGFSGAADLEPVRQAFKQRAPDTELIEPDYLDATPIFGPANAESG